MKMWLEYLYLQTERDVETLLLAIRCADYIREYVNKRYDLFTLLFLITNNCFVIIFHCVL